MNEYLILAIINLLRGYQHSSKRRKQDYKYLASQCIRQYVLPEGHYHISSCANELWSRLTSMDIQEHGYRDSIVCDKLIEAIRIKTYNGASNKGKDTTLYPGDTFIFNDLFHGDHVVPVSFIFKELAALTDDNLVPEVITNIVNKMHICTITKEEDHKIGRTRNRYPSFEETVRYGAYRDIELI